ncbi:MAG: asparagine synthase (glutamine-hydrolyzing) [Parvularculaceae bacterium]|nr:asparagine synthase (glutamine-hydrolyzing) [Parvularculaceae bacterium]
MCGIAGWRRGEGRTVSEAQIRAQCDAIVHRGPDDEGVFVEGALGMGMRRLSIIDIDGGHQPMISADGRYAVVYNGEVYNHLDLRRDLTAKGAVFRTRSDTETVLEAFAAWGDGAFARLDGMFAVAIYDRAEQVLTLARDQIGVKPLYVSEQNGEVAFASEIKALAVVPGFEFDIDERSVHDVFRFGHVLRPRTIYRQVRQVDPGAVERFGPGGAHSAGNFWRPIVRRGVERSPAEWIEATRSEVLASVKRHLLSDVPVGSFLSGGVDSAAVTAAMARQSPARITAFTIGFPGNPIDETGAAKKIADHLGCAHVARPVELGKARDVIPAVQRTFDEPSGASAAVPTWYLSKLASEHVKVVLCGEGGDELFSGYKRHLNARRMDRLRPLISAMGPAASLIEKLPDGAPQWNRLRQHAGRFRRAALLSSGFQRFVAATEIAGPEMRERLFEPEFAAAQDRAADRLEAEYFADPQWRREPMLQQFMLGDLTLHMPSALLNRLDRTSMAHSLEARVPLLSPAFVDFTLSAPLSLKAKGVGKYLLREAARPWLPPETLKRRKQGFQMPLADWFLGDFADFAHDAGAKAATHGYLRPKAVEEIFNAHRRGAADYGKLLYAIVAFSCWWNDVRIRARPLRSQTLRAR